MHTPVATPKHCSCASRLRHMSCTRAARIELLLQLLAAPAAVLGTQSLAGAAGRLRLQLARPARKMSSAQCQDDSTALQPISPNVTCLAWAVLATEQYQTSAPAAVLEHSLAEMLGGRAAGGWAAQGPHTASTAQQLVDVAHALQAHRG